MKLLSALVFVCLLVGNLPAMARPMPSHWTLRSHHHHHVRHMRHARHHAAHHRHHARRYRGRVYETGTILPHPSGCPSRAFCGCGVALKVFGTPVRALWLAANWLRFPRAMAAPGMVAVFGRHHVAYIESVNGDGTALLYDPNSGRHLTREHRRSIRGAVIVNPHGGGFAMNAGRRRVRLARHIPVQ